MQRQKHLIHEKVQLNDYFIDTLEKMLDPIPICFILIDSETRVIMINNQFAAFLGYPKEELLGKKVEEIDAVTRFPEVFLHKTPEIAWKHKFTNGHTAIVHRIPVLDEEKNIQYGFGMILFEDVDELHGVLKKNKILETKIDFYRKEIKKIRGAKYSLRNIAGTSEKIHNCKLLAMKVAHTRSTVLLLGASGTGKELFAHAIHNESDRSENPFIKVNCAAIPSELLEAELFGYEEGAYTGAKKGGKIGKFELAMGGSIFLDEIGDMPMSMQVKLLRVLQEKEIEKIGGNDVIPLDIRIIAATNKNLIQKVKDGSFREDLYYRLNVMSIEIPTLEERKEDIDDVVKVIIKKLCRTLGTLIHTISDDAMRALKDYKWPGNVRELENVLERAINLSDNTVIELEHLPEHIRKNISEKIRKECDEKEIKEFVNLKERIKILEKEAIREAMEITGNNKQKAAQLLGMSRSNFYEKLDKYNI